MLLMMKWSSQAKKVRFLLFHSVRIIMTMGEAAVAAAMVVVDVDG